MTLNRIWCAYVAVDVADKDNRALGNNIAAAAEQPVLHISLQDIDPVPVGKPDAGGFVERYHIPECNAAALAGAQVHEHLRGGGLAARDQVIEARHESVRLRIIGRPLGRRPGNDNLKQCLREGMPL